MNPSHSGGQLPSSTSDSSGVRSSSGGSRPAATARTASPSHQAPPNPFANATTPRPLPVSTRM